MALLGIFCNRLAASSQLRLTSQQGSLTPKRQGSGVPAEMANKELGLGQLPLSVVCHKLLRRARLKLKHLESKAASASAVAVMRAAKGYEGLARLVESSRPICNP